ncbi:MAG TPA: hypothetical protein VGJ28_07445 [Micromonosporaceae bacterium]|jgi:hypothetical protein
MQPESIETPADDAAEQSITVDPRDADTEAADSGEVHRGLEVDEGDATEQARTVNLGDDYEG